MGLQVKVDRVAQFLILLSFNLCASFAGAGGSSTVGPPGPSGRAELLFAQDASVSCESQLLSSRGYRASRPDTAVFIDRGNCRRPTPDATFTVCDYVYEVRRTFLRGSDPVHVIRRVVFLGADGKVAISNANFPGFHWFPSDPPFAQANSDEGIYQSLLVLEQIEEAVGARTGVKSVGGLKCSKTQIVRPGAPPEFSCSLDPMHLDAELIYRTLDLPETSSSVPGRTTYVKRVGDLSCTKTQIVAPNVEPTFSCTYKGF